MNTRTPNNPLDTTGYFLSYDTLALALDVKVTFAANFFETLKSLFWSASPWLLNLHFVALDKQAGHLILKGKFDYLKLLDNFFDLFLRSISVDIEFKELILKQSFLCPYREIDFAYEDGLFDHVYSRLTYEEVMVVKKRRTKLRVNLAMNSLGTAPSRNRIMVVLSSLNDSKDETCDINVKYSVLQKFVPFYSVYREAREANNTDNLLSSWY